MKALRRPELAAGLLAVGAMLAAFAIANSPLRPLYELVHHTPVALRVGTLYVEKPLISWINEGLMSMAVLMGTAAGLVLGKPLGIVGAAWLATRLGAGRLPAGVRWLHICGAALLGGIGFTMSLFFAALAFGANDILALSAKIGVLAGSLLAAVLGTGLLWLVARRLTLPRWEGPYCREAMKPIKENCND